MVWSRLTIGDCTFTTHSLHIHYTFTTHSPHIHHTFTTHSPHLFKCLAWLGLGWVGHAVTSGNRPGSRQTGRRQGDTQKEGTHADKADQKRYTGRHSALKPALTTVHDIFLPRDHAYLNFLAFLFVGWYPSSRVVATQRTKSM